jgi:hypothetical protein
MTVLSLEQILSLLKFSNKILYIYFNKNKNIDILSIYSSILIILNHVVICYQLFLKNNLFFYILSLYLPKLIYKSYIEHFLNLFNTSQLISIQLIPFAVGSWNNLEMKIELNYIFSLKYCNPWRTA